MCVHVLPICIPRCTVCMPGAGRNQKWIKALELEINYHVGIEDQI